ncbi:MAG: site-specific DNA-methyltransferase [Hyphomicrobium sp.]
MPEVHFKGKEFVFNHHLTVPYRPLVPDAARSVGPADLSGNLLIHGDNLEALKALLPVYAGKVDCVFIDPPYNTGKEGWSYNDAVNSPMMREWLRKTVDRDDLLRHDKWLCMMWPRLRLLHELLSDRGSIWITLDDNEAHHARAALDEIFGDQNFVATCVWHKMDSPKNTARHFSVDHDYILVYAKNKEAWRVNLVGRTEEMIARYQNPDNDPRGPWIISDLDARNYYSEGKYPITTPTGRVISGPPAGRYWTVSKKKFEALLADNRIWWGADGNGEPNIKRFLSEVRKGVVPQTIWNWADVGSTRHAKSELLKILSGAAEEDDGDGVEDDDAAAGEEAVVERAQLADAPDEQNEAEAEEGEVFVTPKPTRLIERIIQLATGPDSIVLDSFAGSGTTGHAVLAANAKDGGSRRFILVELEDYADTLTAERLRRVINGYEFQGKQKEELLRETVSFGTLKKARSVLERIAAIENLERHRFDAVKKQVKKGILTVIGEKRVTERADGLPGGFTYCTLGAPLDLDALLVGDAMPSFEALGGWLFHTATGTALDPARLDEASGFLGEGGGWAVSLIYRPDRAWLESPEAALTLDRAKAIAAAHPGARQLVFAAVSYVPSRVLDELGVTHVPLPFALFRVEQGS